MVAKTVARKKSPEIVKEELLNSLRESDTVEEREFSIKNVIRQREATNLFKGYEELINTGNNKV